MKIVNSIRKFTQPRRGALGPTQLIAIILLLTFAGIGVYYYQLRNATPTKPAIGTKSGTTVAFPIDAVLREATQRSKNIVFGGPPRAASGTALTMLQNIAYHSGYSEDRRNPIWVAYRLDTKVGNEILKRPKGFKSDMRTRSHISTKDYSKSGYDRGHMAPNSAIATRYGLDAQVETFLLSNIVPQRPDLNRKIWQRLERLEDEYANRFAGIWVITGPIFDEHIEQIDNHIEIPDAFYKIIFDEENGSLRAEAFILPQDVTGKEPIDQFLTNIDEIEKLTGLDFIAPMADEYENRLEAAATGHLW